jgi:hypothetical protein
MEAFRKKACMLLNFTIVLTFLIKIRYHMLGQLKVAIRTRADFKGLLMSSNLSNQN